MTGRQKPVAQRTPPAELAALLSREPPRRPAEALERVVGLQTRLAEYDPFKAGSVLAGLSLEPRYQAHLTRIDAALRLVLCVGRGRHGLHRSAAMRLLNSDLVTAQFDRLEDPPETSFIEALPTLEDGDVRFFAGYRENARYGAEVVLRAFRALPDTPEKEEALRQCRALLRLSEALVARQGLERGIVGSGAPFKPLALPSEQRLKTLSKRVVFTWADLTALDIDPADLEPFDLGQAPAGTTLSARMGDGALDLRPLLVSADALLIAAPFALSTAIRGLLIGRAIAMGQDLQLRLRMLQVQSRLVGDSGFLETSDVRPRPIAGHPGREYLQQISAGRYLHVIETIDDFTDWPNRAFGSQTACDEALVEAVAAGVRGARDQAEGIAGFQEGLTIWLAGGWGSARGVLPERLTASEAWPVLILDPADAAVLGLSKNGKVEDLWRLEKIRAQVEAQGFLVDEVNGPLNLFQWWVETDLALVPPSARDAQPPLFVQYPIDLVLQTRLSACDRCRPSHRHSSGSGPNECLRKHVALGKRA